MESAAHDVFVVFNVCEGIFWVAIAVGILIALYRKRQNAGLMVLLAILFAAYGVSDWVEIRTGGWYKPWWMLAWKASNVVGFTATFLSLRRRQSPSKGQSE